MYDGNQALVFSPREVSGMGGEKVKDKISIFLCDMVHNYLGAGTYMFPLNIGYIGAYTKKFFSEKVEIKLFKYPDILLQELGRKLPDVIGFSHYTWNADLNNKLSRFVKSISEQTIIVFGGPNINYTEQGINKFFGTFSAVDFYVPFQGETPFVNLLNMAFESDMDLSRIKKKKIDGVFFLNNESGKVVVGNRLERIKNPDEVPSPYLTGLMDEFFNYDLIPIIETNRGCPYQCTYCCQGISSFRQIDFFSLDRVMAEIIYISERVKKTNILNLADSNFGIAQRDFEIADFIERLSRECGYPRKVNTNWAKNQDRIYEIANQLKNINLVVSLQSLDDAVLKNIKRKNIKISVFKDIVEKVNQSGNMSGTEIILGLPGETKQSHIDSLKTLFDWNVSYIICYSCLILDGSELALDRDQGRFDCTTKFRLIDSSFGKYNGILSLECEEGIRSTETMTEEEVLFFRPVHWLIQFLWNYRFYYDFLKFIQSAGINPMDFIITLIENARNGPASVKTIFDEFEHEAREEWFDTVDDLYAHYSKKENFCDLDEGLFGKMNGKYIFKVLLDAKDEFEAYLLKTALAHTGLGKKAGVLKALMSFHSAAIIDSQQINADVLPSQSVVLDYDILRWRQSNYSQPLDEAYRHPNTPVLFRLSAEQQESLQKLNKQYHHKNPNVTLRKMSEFMPISDFFYRPEKGAGNGVA